MQDFLEWGLQKTIAARDRCQMLFSSICAASLKDVLQDCLQVAATRDRAAFHMHVH